MIEIANNHSEDATTLSNSSSCAIETRNLNIYYDDFLAIKDANLKIHPQMVTAIIGPSGCGKSTMLRAFDRMTCTTTASYLAHTHIYSPRRPVRMRANRRPVSNIQS